jgi:mTERF domain-containing protein
MIEHPERLGVPHGSGMFKIALRAVGFLSDEKIGAKLSHIKECLGCSEDELDGTLRKAPTLLSCSNEKIRHRSQFLRLEVGLEPTYIAQRPFMIAYSLESRH